MMIKILNILMLLIFSLLINCQIDINSSNTHTTTNLSLTVIPDTTIILGDTVNFFVSVSNSESKIKKYLWDFNGKGYDTTTSPQCTVYFNENHIGKNEITVRAFTYPYLLPCSDSIIVNIGVIEPIVKILSSDTTIFCNEPFTVKATAKAYKNNSVKLFISLDGIVYDKTADSSFVFIWPENNTGPKVIYFKAVDQFNSQSKIDSTVIHVISKSSQI